MKLYWKPVGSSQPPVDFVRTDFTTELDNVFR